MCSDNKENILIIEAASPWQPHCLTMCTAATDLLHWENLPESTKQHSFCYMLFIRAENIVSEEMTFTMYVTFHLRIYKYQVFLLSETNVISTRPHSHPKRDNSQSPGVTKQYLCLHLSSNPEWHFLLAHDLMLV